MIKQMSYTVGGLLAIAAIVCLAGHAQPARADVSQATIQLASLLRTGDCCTTEPAPACCPAPTCCPTPCITYRHAIFCRKVCCDSCQPNIQTVLKVKDPCTCCTVDVPVCLPPCCKGEPEVCSWCGAFGRSNVSYDYCCGVTVVVTFKRCGDVLVTYRGA
jgi:hypothetical protein